MGKAGTKFIAGGSKQSVGVSLSLHGPGEDGVVGKVVKRSKFSVDLSTERNVKSLIEANAVSSAVVGGYINRFKDMPVSQSQLRMISGTYRQALDATSYYAANAPADSDSAFQVAESTRRPASKDEACSSWLQRASKEQTIVLADGGNVDNTGIASVLQADKDVDTVTAFITRQAGSDGKMKGPLVYDDLARLLGGYTVKTENFASLSYYPIFETTVTQLEQKLRKKQIKMSVIKPATGRSKVFKGVKYFTFSTKTRDQPWFNISPGRKVTVNVVYVDTTVAVGAVKQIAQYDTLVTEIMATLAQNNVANGVLKFF